LIALPTAAPRATSKGRAKTARRTRDFTEPPDADIEYTAPADPDAALVPLTAIPPAVAPSVLPSSSCTRTVELAERSVLVARIGGSWASAIVLTGNGYLMTNAHLLRPFLETPDTPSPSTPAKAVEPSFAPDGSTISPPEAPSHLLYEDAIRLKRHVKVSVRLESTHMQLQPDEDPSTIEAEWMTAHLVYVSQGPWDVAIMKINSTHPLHAVAIHPSYRHATTQGQRECLPAVGSRALAVGHALFAPGSALAPTVTAGVLSKIVYLQHTVPSSGIPSEQKSAPDIPSLLVTSAAVHNGNSGGLLVDEQTGYLLGMVTSNVMHTPVEPNYVPEVHVRKGRESYAPEEELTILQQQFDETAKAQEEARQSKQVQLILPHLNFTIPYTALLPLVEFCEGGASDLALLRALEHAPPLVQRLWQLNQLQDLPPPVPDFSPKYSQLLQEISSDRPQNAGAKL
jgi:hypothetical protein